VEEIYSAPLLDLVFRAASVHRKYHDPNLVQKCTLLSIKTGGCPEDCNYCSQSSKHSETTGTKATKLLDLEEVYEAAKRAKASGSTRFCMGAAWRGPSQVRVLTSNWLQALYMSHYVRHKIYSGPYISMPDIFLQVGQRQWTRVLEMVKKIRALDMEVCTTLGMLTPEQAADLRDAGLTAYNHNLDTSPEYYSQVTKTRKYEDRLDTLETVRKAGISVCAGGIIGLGEGPKDRVGLLMQLATLPSHPESVPINRLVAVPGTPFEDNKVPSGMDLVRCIATARILMPQTVVRLSAGRLELTPADQVCSHSAAKSFVAYLLGVFP
jgi:biotin synthase